MSRWTKAPRQVSCDTSLFAIGDIHGHADELRAMQSLIHRLIECSTTTHSLIVYLGDYVDRGPAIGRTLDLLSLEPAVESGIDRIHLVGNHDQFLIELLGCDPALDRAFLTAWFDNGGESTLRDLGVEGYGRLFHAGAIKELSARTRHALGTRRVEFLNGLRPFHRHGPYVFVHAGIVPGRALDAQDFADLVLIREPFLSAGQGWRHDFTVVHGHSISMPVVHPHRIGVDAGCYLHGALCAVQIEHDRLRFLGVSRNPQHPWQDQLGRKGLWQWEPVAPRSGPTLAINGDVDPPARPT